MKLADVPQAALRAPATPIPTRVVPDWEALYQTMLTNGFVVIDSEVERTMANGSQECVLVKAFNCHVRGTKKQKLRTKRIGTTRWFCSL